MANGDIPPVKDRLEMMTATQKDDTGLTAGLLRVLNRQVCDCLKTFSRNCLPGMVPLHFSHTLHIFYSSLHKCSVCSTLLFCTCT